MAHVATITLLCLALFVNDQTRENKAVYIAIAGFAVLWLPFESFFIPCIRVEMGENKVQSETPSAEVVMTPHRSWLRISF